MPHPHLILRPPFLLPLALRPQLGGAFGARGLGCAGGEGEFGGGAGLDVEAALMGCAAGFGGGGESGEEAAEEAAVAGEVGRAAAACGGF